MSDAPQRDDYDSSLFTGRNRIFGEDTLLGRIGDFYRNLGNQAQDYFTDYKSDDLAEYSADYDAWLNQTQMNREDTQMSRRAADLESAGYAKWFSGSGAPVGAGTQLGERGLSGGDAKRAAITTSIQAMLGMAQAGKTNAETKLIDAQAENMGIKNRFDTQTYADRVSQVTANLDKTRADTALAKTNNILASEHIKTEQINQVGKRLTNELTRVGITGARLDLIIKHTTIALNRLQQRIHEHNLDQADQRGTPVGAYDFRSRIYTDILGFLERLIAGDVPTPGSPVDALLDELDQSLEDAGVQPKSLRQTLTGSPYRPRDLRPSQYSPNMNWDQPWSPQWFHHYNWDRGQYNNPRG